MPSGGGLFFGGGCGKTRGPGKTEFRVGKFGGAGRATKGPPQRRTAFVGRGEAKTQAVFSACGKCSGVSCASTNWGSVVLKEYTPSVFAYGEATSHRVGGFMIAAGDVILQGKMTGPSGGRSLRTILDSRFEFPVHFSFFILHFSFPTAHYPFLIPHSS